MSAVVQVDVADRAWPELLDATTVLCGRFGARVTFNAEFPSNAVAEFRKLFEARGVKMIVRDGLMICAPADWPSPCGA